MAQPRFKKWGFEASVVTSMVHTTLRRPMYNPLLANCGRATSQLYARHASARGGGRWDADRW